jgi:hypothetical protein
MRVQGYKRRREGLVQAKLKNRKCSYLVGGTNDSRAAEGSSEDSH